jgi:hypothetical protein
MMSFLIADTFSDSLARLTGDEQKAVKTTAFDLQMNPSAPGFSFHRLDKARDKRFWSVRVNADIRLIIHKTDASLLLCYVDRHDRAYAWAERRKLEVHPATGAAQIIELRESIREIVIPTYVPAADNSKTASKPLSGTADDTLLRYGVPPEWLNDVREADEDTLLKLTEHLPAEAAEALLELATGGTPKMTPSDPLVAFDRDFDVHVDARYSSLPSSLPVPETGLPLNSFIHPDAQRRFRVVNSVDELERALDAPWDKWAVFLHPEQRELVTRDFSGPARVAGSAGTGKTVVALHRAVHLARVRGVNYFCRSATTISAGEGLAKERRWRPQRNSVIVAGRSRPCVITTVFLLDQGHDDGGGRSWKTVCGFPRTGGRVLCVHGSGSVHGLLGATGSRKDGDPSVGPSVARRSWGILSGAFVTTPPRVGSDWVFHGVSRARS